MSDTENRQFEVRWRTFLGGKEGLDTRTFIAAFFQHDKDLLVFKRVGGAPVFTVAEALVETIEVSDLPESATGGPVPPGQAYLVGEDPGACEMLPRAQIAEGSTVSFTLGADSPMVAEGAAEFRRMIRQGVRRDPGTAVA